MRTTKYTYLTVIQQHCGQGWEDVGRYELKRGKYVDREPNGKATIHHDLKEYRLTGYPTRTVNRKELNVN